jgi:hypothetical protein
MHPQGPSSKTCVNAGMEDRSLARKAGLEAVAANHSRRRNEGYRVKEVRR